MQSTVTFVTTSMDSAFVAAKRGQCGAIYASGRDLKDLVPALRRDQIAFRYLPVWNEPEQVNQARKAIADGKLQEVQQVADRQKQAQDEQRLAAVKANEEAVVKARKQAELQQQYGAMARAFEGALTVEIKDFVESRSNRAGSKYPDIAVWYRGQQQDHWELMTVETSLLDYGIAEFKGRPLETAFARTNIKMRNRILGEYKETCFITGFISDQEFQMDREPVSASCEDPGNTMQTYRQGQRFTSRWLVP
jgi:predicted  nucleic acid-binding Zn-ribbon protein